MYGAFRNGGRLVWRSLKTKKLRDARRQLILEMDCREKTAQPLKEGMTLEELLQLYEQGFGAYAKRTVANRRSILNKLRKSWLPDLHMKVSAITPAHLKTWLASQAGRMKAVSVNDYLIVLRGVFNLAVEARAILEPPTRQIKRLHVDSPMMASLVL